jgi:hypothetical protein
MSKIVLPEKLSCIAVDHRGDFCAGGTANGRLYLWEVGICVLGANRLCSDLNIFSWSFRLHLEYCLVHLRAIIVVYRLCNLLGMVPALSLPAMTLASMSGPCQGQ